MQKSVEKGIALMKAQMMIVSIIKIWIAFGRMVNVEESFAPILLSQIVKT